MSNRGGYRPGAGRPTGTGKFKEKTTAIRIPCGLLPEVEELLSRYQEIKNKPSNVVPLFDDKVAAGQPSFADGYIEDRIDLSSYLVTNPQTTFLVRAQGESMINVGIYPDSLLVVDSSITPESGRIVIAAVDGDLTVKRLKLEQNKIILLPENPNFQPIIVSNDASFSISGVVTRVINQPI